MFASSLFGSIHVSSDAPALVIPAIDDLPLEVRTEITQRLQAEFDAEFEAWKTTAKSPDDRVLAEHRAELQRIDADRQSEIDDLHRIIDANEQKRRERAAEEERFNAEKAALAAEITRLNDEIEAIQNRHREEQARARAAIEQRRIDLRSERTQLDADIKNAIDARSRLEREVNELNANVQAEERRRDEQRKGVDRVRNAVATLLGGSPFSVVTLVQCLGTELNAVNELRARDGLPPFDGPRNGSEIVLTEEHAKALIREPGHQTLQRTYQDLETYYDWKVKQLKPGT